MSGIVQVGLVGGGAWLADLVRYAAPLEGMRLAAWWPGGEDASEAAALGAAVVPDWREMAASPALQALVVLGGADALEAAEAGLMAGKAVLLPGACVASEADAARLARAEGEGGGTLLCGAELSSSATGLHARAALATGSPGTLHSLYLSIRAPRPVAGTPAVLDALGWEAFGFVTDCLPGELLHLQATGGALFGAAADTVVVLARFAPAVVATIELSQCLPPTIPVGRHGEAQFEIVGGAEVLRGEPFGSTVRLHAEAGSAALPWGDDPVIAMLAALPDGVAGRIAAGRDLAAHRRVLAMRAAVERSLQDGGVVRA